MKIVSWNCNGAFRKKFSSIAIFNADIYVIQECEDPKRSKSEDYKNWASNHLWVGDTKNKGVGIFAKRNIKLEKLDWTSNYEGHSVKYFLPCLVNGDFQLLGIWTHRNKSPNFGYIGQFWKYLKVNLEEFDKIIIAGDLNSNSIWDQWDRWWNHSDVVRILENKGIRSIYHELMNEFHGKESFSTFYLQKNLEKRHHIDYFFASNHYINNKIEICKFRNWKDLSDHVPLIFENPTNGYETNSLHDR